MSRHALHIECYRASLRALRAARTLAMELPASEERTRALESLGALIDEQCECMARLRVALRAEVRQ